MSERIWPNARNNARAPAMVVHSGARGPHVEERPRGGHRLLWRTTREAPWRESGGGGPPCANSAKGLPPPPDSRMPSEAAILASPSGHIAGPCHNVELAAPPFSILRAPFPSNERRGPPRNRGESKSKIIGGTPGRVKSLTLEADMVAETTAAPKPASFNSRWSEFRRQWPDLDQCRPMWGELGTTPGAGRPEVVGLRPDHNSGQSPPTSTTRGRSWSTLAESGRVLASVVQHWSKAVDWCPKAARSSPAEHVLSEVGLPPTSPRGRLPGRTERLLRHLALRQPDGTHDLRKRHGRRQVLAQSA